jgi:hypothetical protein
MTEATDPYARLGIEQDAGFEAVQAARDARLKEAGDDPLARSRVEAAYDAVLMDRLKERQQGRVSSAARNASQREQATPPPNRPVLPALPSLPALPANRLPRPEVRFGSFALATGRELWFPLVVHGALAALLLVSTAPPELLLALGSLATLLNLQRRRSRFLAALAWTFGLLGVGLILGSLLLGAVFAQLPVAFPLTPLQIQSLPALLLLVLGALLVD